MRSINARLYVTLDGVMEAPENWVIADDEMVAANEADYAQADAVISLTYRPAGASGDDSSTETAREPAVLA